MLNGKGQEKHSLLLHADIIEIMTNLPSLTYSLYLWTALLLCNIARPEMHLELVLYPTTSFSPN